MRAIRIVSASLCLLWFFIAAQASAQARDAVAKPQTAAPGSAKLYLLSPKGLISSPATPDITVDGHKFGGLAAGTYFAVSRTPGHHTLEVGGRFLSAAQQNEVEFAAGQTYFIEISTCTDSIGMLAIQSILSGTGGTRLRGGNPFSGLCFYSLDPEHGRAEIAKLQNVTH
jgi:hypothetical protein